MTYQGITKSVCDDYFGPKEAAVACMELYGAPGVLQYNLGYACQWDSYTNGFWVDDVVCNGDEIRYADCARAPLGTHNCGV